MVKNNFPAPTRAPVWDGEWAGLPEERYILAVPRRKGL